MDTNQVKKRRKVPRTEIELQEFLKQIGCEYETQSIIDNSPFRKRGKHKADFKVVSVKGKTLYVEVKGFLTFYSVNVLEYLLRYSRKAFYVYQATEEDWMGAVREGQSAADKIEQNKIQQKSEIKDFINGKVSATQLAKRSLDRLQAYKKLRAGDVERWCKMMKDNKKAGRRSNQTGKRVGNKGFNE